MIDNVKINNYNLSYGGSKEMKNKLTSKEINNIAKVIAKTNTDVWNVIASLEDMSSILSDIDLNDKDLVIKIMKAFKQLEKNDETFIDAEKHFADFEEYTNIGKKFNEVLKEL